MCIFLFAPLWADEAETATDEASTADEPVQTSVTDRPVLNGLYGGIAGTMTTDLDEALLDRGYDWPGFGVRVGYRWPHMPSTITPVDKIFGSSWWSIAGELDVNTLRLDGQEMLSFSVNTKCYTPIAGFYGAIGFGGLYHRDDHDDRDLDLILRGAFGFENSLANSDRHAFFIEFDVYDAVRDKAPGTVSMGLLFRF